LKPADKRDARDQMAGFRQDVFFVHGQQIGYLFAPLYILRGIPNPDRGLPPDGDGNIDVADVFYLINFLFAGGPVPK
jgi:hypothetical protein